jgi:hypothetical protein
MNSMANSLKSLWKGMLNSIFFSKINYASYNIFSQLWWNASYGYLFVSSSLTTKRIKETYLLLICKVTFDFVFSIWLNMQKLFPSACREFWRWIHAFLPHICEYCTMLFSCIWESFPFVVNWCVKHFFWTPLY